MSGGRIKTDVKRFACNQVDNLIYEEGCFSALNWFLREGMLNYDLYQRWRSGEIDYLEKYVVLPADEFIVFFSEVENYARTLGLEQELIDYYSTEGKTLKFSSDPDRDVLYKTTFKPPQDRVQLDLFFDCSSACINNDLVVAIINNQKRDIRRLLSVLRQTELNKAQQFERILAAKDDIHAKTQSAHYKLNVLNRELILLAVELMGHYAQDFLTPLWRTLANDFSSQAFDPQAPDFHSSYCAFKGLQWREVLSSIQQEHNWRQQPLLLQRFAEASFKLHNDFDGLECWFRLFLFFPDVAAKLINRTGYRLLLEDWQQFQGLDPELGHCYFPVWVLLNKPALARRQFAYENSTSAVKAFTLIHELLLLSDSSLDHRVIDLRKKLKQHYPALFVHFMNH